ncbi:MAG: DUF507 family protein [Bryobacteraceae bacterium]
MLLSREFISYLSRQLVKRTTPQIIETSSAEAAAEMISHLIEEELQVEDRLNDEVRELLSQYSDYMRREGVSYQEMFRRIKNTLISQRKVIRASGRDTGDNMKLSRDKINDISHKLVAAFRKSREFRLKKEPNDVRLAIVQGMTELLGVEERVDRAARTKIRSQKKEIPEGTEEWDLLHRRYYAEEFKKFGIDLTR